jgi:HEAT repeat protein
MPLFGPPNIEKMKANRDKDGLVKALEYKKDSQVRCEAALALGWIHEIDPLIPLLQDEDPDMRAAASEALEKIRDWHISIIDKNFTPGTFFLSDLQKLEKNGVPAVEPLIQTLGRTEGRDRKSILAVLAALKDARAVDAILALLKDSDAAIRLSAIQTLEKIGDLRAADPLVCMLVTRDLNIRRAIIQALDTFGWSPSPDQMGAIYLVGKRHWKECLKIGAPAMVPLLEALQDKGAIHTGAIEVLGEIGDARAVEPLLQLLKVDSLKVRLATITALGRIGDERAIKPLLSMLVHDDGNIRAAAVMSLGNFKDDCILDPLAARLQDRTDKVRIQAVKTLGRYGVAHSLEPLSVALRDVDSEVRRSALEVLTTSDDPAVVPALIQALDGWDEDMREKATAALVRFADVRAIEPLSKELQSEEYTRRARAARALVGLYQSGKLDPKQKQVILAWKSIIMDKEHTDTQFSHSDHGSGSCHDDTQSRHMDITYPGIDFPL